jgi:hypothetical protein
MKCRILLAWVGGIVAEEDVGMLILLDDLLVLAIAKEYERLVEE